MSDQEYFVSWHIVKQIAQGVVYLHSQQPRVIHRDLKPANVLFTDEHGDNFIKLCDFGLSIKHETKRSNHTYSQGTKKYMAPEVMSLVILPEGDYTSRYNEKADVYSMAVMALEVFGLDIGREKNE